MSQRENGGFASTKSFTEISLYKTAKTPTESGFSADASFLCPHSGGEGGIRTLETLLRPTRFPIVRARPNYATSPWSRNKFMLPEYNTPFWARSQEKNLLSPAAGSAAVHDDSPLPPSAACRAAARRPSAASRSRRRSPAAFTVCAGAVRAAGSPRRARVCQKAISPAASGTVSAAAAQNRLWPAPAASSRSTYAPPENPSAHRYRYRRILRRHSTTCSMPR